MCDPIQALEYLLWASISLELSVPLMTVKYLSWIVTLYSAVCHCYYDNQAAVQAEVRDARHQHSDTYKHTIIQMSTNSSQANETSCKYLTVICTQSASRFLLADLPAAASCWS